MEKEDGELQTLVFHCHSGETIKLGDDIEVVMLGSHNGVIHIGIEAPKALKVVKSTLHERELEHGHHSLIT